MVILASEKAASHPGIWRSPLPVETGVLLEDLAFGAENGCRGWSVTVEANVGGGRSRTATVSRSTECGHNRDQNRTIGFRYLDT